MLMDNMAKHHAHSTDQVSGISGADSQLGVGQVIPPTGQFSGNLDCSPTIAVPQVVVSAFLHASFGPHFVNLLGGPVCAVPYKGPAEGNAIQVGQVSHVLSPSLLNRGHNRCQNVWLGLLQV